jgi:glycosyltransferase involved in cell wall biosynthesis
MQSGATVLSKLDRVRDEIGDLFPQSAMVRNRSIAVLLPCYNEEAAIASVIEGFQRALPGARIYVYDNNSTDGTYGRRRRGRRYRPARDASGQGQCRPPHAGRHRRRYLYSRRRRCDLRSDRGRGALIEALVTRNLDMMVGTCNGGDGAFPRGHRFGNHLFNRIMANMFGDGFTDILSGYRAVAALRKIVSGHVQRVRDRGGAVGARAGPEDRDRRNAAALRDAKDRKASCAPIATARASC